jgi:hypothetical protein
MSEEAPGALIDAACDAAEAGIGRLSKTLAEQEARVKAVEAQDGRAGAALAQAREELARRAARLDAGSEARRRRAGRLVTLAPAFPGPLSTRAAIALLWVLWVLKVAALLALGLGAGIAALLAVMQVLIALARTAFAGGAP